MGTAFVKVARFFNGNKSLLKSLWLNTAKACFSLM